MKRLIIHGDPGIRKDAVIEVDGEEYTCFSVTRNGDWHGPEEVQLWCTVGDADEREDFARRNFIPMHLDVVDVDAGAVTVVKAKGDLAV
ncbi:HAH_0734 family protein [Halosegnis marinus]|uniref:HAH_0734 family protein n=1 Tax=Halosegnis marinus TaxID=3034023 RepID=A0ABD5ZRL7_9EURY|nr:HAH_0734 family protein [Halosegnis sp. DT85]